MAIVSVDDLGQYGVVKATKPEELPVNAWSDAKNFRFVNGYAERFLGHTDAFGTPTVPPYHLLHMTSATLAFWLYAGLAKIYVYDGTTHTDLTRAVGGDYSATADDSWVSTVLGGVPIFNNPNDLPQMWLPQQTSQAMQDLSNWNVNWFCQSLRAYKQFLVALNMTKTSIVYPHMVKWSHGAAPGAVPASWDETDPTKDTGEYTLSDTPDVLVDQRTLRDTNMLYKENTTWAMQYIGGTPVFRFVKVFGTQGILAKRCAVEYFSGLHFVLGDSDIISHNGQEAQSLLKRRMRQWFYNQIDPTYYNRSFTVVNFARREVWACVPLLGSTLPNFALVWNFEENTIGFRDLPTAAHLAYGVSNEGISGDTWQLDSAAWDSDVTVWQERLFNPTQRALYAAVPGATQIYRMDIGGQFDAVNFDSYVERERMGIVMRAKQPPDMTQQKYVTRLWPRIEAPDGTIVSVYLKGHQDNGTGVTYNSPKTFTVGTDKFVDFRETGRTFSLKFGIATATQAKIHGYELEVRKSGKH